MKKRIAILCLIVLPLAVLHALSLEGIGRDEARDIALKDAGLSLDQVRIHEVELNRKDGQTFYDIEFSDADRHYFYAVRGDRYILKRVVEEMHGPVLASRPAVISSAEAAKAARDAVGWPEKDGIIEKLELDEEKGRMVYEVKLRRNKEKYEILLDASTRRIIEIERD